MQISIIIPAFNEAKRIGGCIQSIRAAVAANLRPALETELIVVDNNSNDSTAEIAAREGARVVFEPINQISRARTAGAGAAAGDWFLFIDADSQLNTRLFRDVLAAIDSGTCAGGGSVIRLDAAPWPGRLVIALWNPMSLLFTMLGGCFIFCRADAFRVIGGFSLELFTTEELKFGADLKRWARARGLRVVVLRSSPVITSGRKFGLYTKREWVRFFWEYASSPRQAMRERHDLHYDGRR